MFKLAAEISKLKVQIFLFISTFALYLHHISPSVYGGDAGDFITAATTLGVPHPSGYPLHTLFAIFANYALPDFFTPAWKVGVVSAFFAAAGIWTAYNITHSLTKDKVISFIGSLITAFTYTYWLFGVTVEVFSLHIFLVLNLVWATLRYTEKKENKYLFPLAFLGGLALTNNLTVLAIFPPVFLAIIFAKQTVIRDINLLTKCFLFAILGLVPYVYIPLAAGSNPGVNWGFAKTLTNFVALVLRQDYSWVTGSAIEKATVTNSFGAYSDYLIYYVGWPIIVLAIFGGVGLIVKKRFLVACLIFSAYFLSGPFFIFYANTPLENFLRAATFEKFYLTGIVLLTLLAPLGISFLITLFSKVLMHKGLVKVAQTATLITFALVPINLLLINYQKTNFHSIYIGDYFAFDLLNSLPQKSVVYITSDTLAFNSIYLQKSLEIREDIYLPGLYEGFTDILKTTGMNDDEVNNYKIKRRGIIDKELIYASYAPILKERAIFSELPLEMIDNNYGKIISIPWGLVYKLEFEENATPNKDEYIKAVLPILESYHTDEFAKFSKLTDNNLVYADIQKIYSLAYERTAKFLYEKYGEEELSTALLQKSIQLDPLQKI